MTEEMKAVHKVPAIVLRTLFKPGSWLSKIDFINHLILFNNVVVTVLAETDGGKSSFCNLLQTNLEQQIHSVLYKATPNCDTDTILEQIAQQLGLEKSADMDSLSAQISERQAHVLIIIDDAHNLSDSFLKDAIITTKKQAESGFFHLCLVADFALTNRLNAFVDDTNDNIIHRIDLGELTENETRTYVLQRAMVANLITLPLPDAYFKEFYQSTNGNLAKINSGMESFIVNCKHEKKVVKKSYNKQITAVCAAVVFIASSYLVLAKLDKLPWSQTVDEKKLAELTAVAAVPVAELALSQANFHSHVAYWLESSQHQFMEVALPTQETLEDEELENISRVALVDKVVIIPKITPGVDLSRAQALVVKEASASALHVNKQTRQVAKHLPTLYTIQLVASHDIADVTRFRESTPLLAESKLRHFNNVKGSWYILTMGEYVNRNQAQSQTKQLPAQLAKLNPWVRPITGLKDLG